MYMGKLDVKSKQNPRLLQKTLADGRKSLYLEYYYQHREYYDEEFGRQLKRLRKNWNKNKVWNNQLTTYYNECIVKMEIKSCKVAYQT